MDKRERIAKALAGKFICREGSLSFSCPKIELALKAGESITGSFTVTGQEGLPLLGRVLTGDGRMHCLTPEITENPAEISYRFDSAGLDEGDTVRGMCKIISNQGEYTLSYTAAIYPKIFETSLGQMKNLFHFANLARTSWQEAVRVFYDPDFARILTGNDRQYLNIYRAFSRPPQKEQKVEEFLIRIRKKQQVTYLPDREEIMVSCTEDITREVILLTRNGWGYTNLTVETDGEFLETEKSMLTDDDFLGNQCACPLLIFREALHMGCNYGYVRLYNEYVSLKIPVCVNHADVPADKGKRSRKKKTMEFYRYYLLYSMGKIPRQQWLTETERIVEGMEAPQGKDPVQELFRAHILLTRRRKNEAKLLLEQAGSLIVPEETKPEVSCYYLYLTSLVSEDENYIRAVTEEIRRVYYSDQTNWETAWLLLYLDGEFARSLSRRWLFLEQQFEKGCRSPVWYMEAAKMVRKHPAFLMKLTPFVIQILNFMAKYDYLTDECIGQIHYLAERLKQFSERMYDILQICYREKNDAETLHAICALLIKGNKIDPKYAHWYRKGIEKELWLTRLYEYYMLSIDLRREKEIPPAALRYFSYRCELPYDRTAYLYAHIIRKAGEYPDLYRNCLPDMEKFLAEQLEKGHMNRDIACLYRKMMQEGFVGAQMLNQYAVYLFFHEIEVTTPEIQNVIVVHGKLKEEAVCPVSGGVAHVPVFDRDFSLIFENASGSRFVSNVSYEDRALFHPQEMLPILFLDKSGLYTDQVGVLIYQCEHGKSYMLVERGNVAYAAKLWASGEIEESYRNELGMKLLQYYEREELTEQMDQFLTQLQPGPLSGRERSEAIRSLILRGMYDQALTWIHRYGAEKLTPKTVVRFCSRLIPHMEDTESETMTALAWISFCNGKYDDHILQYLSRYYNGTIRELKEIRDACGRFEISGYKLCERLLIQMLFVNEYIEEEAEVFRTYLEGSADEILTDSYLEHFARQYVIYDREPEAFIWKELKRKSRNGDACQVMCELALLAHFAESGEPDEEERQMARVFLDDLVMKRGIVLKSFCGFADLYPFIRFYEDRIFLEYKTESRNPLMLHYMIRNGQENGEYRTEELQSRCPGVYTGIFPLFRDEDMEYYVTERKGEKEMLVHSGSLQGGTAAEKKKGRLASVNRYLAAVSDPDTAGREPEDILEEYLRTDFYAEKLFTLI